jgi:hypothetical protein
MTPNGPSATGEACVDTGPYGPQLPQNRTRRGESAAYADNGRICAPSELGTNAWRRVHLWSLHRAQQGVNKNKSRAYKERKPQEVRHDHQILLEGKLLADTASRRLSGEPRISAHITGDRSSLLIYTSNNADAHFATMCAAADSTLSSTSLSQAARLCDRRRCTL